MAIDAGTVYYTVDANTQKAIDSASEIKTSLEQMQTAMAKTDLQTKQYVKTLTDAGNSISKAGVVLDEFGNINTQATAKMQKLMAMSDSLNQRHIQLSKTATGVRTGIAGIGRNAGQAAIQFQQLIGQIQGGQDAMLALSAQSADLGFVLGAPLLGAVIGIGASLAGMLIPNLFKTTNALEDVEKATERVKAAITLSSEGITGYSEQMKVLAGVSQSLARVKLANLIADQANAMKIAAESVGDEITDALSRPFSSYASNIKDIFGTTSAYAYEAAAELRGAANELSSGITTEGIDKLAKALEMAIDAGINNTEAGRLMVSNMTDLIAKYKLGELTIQQFKEQLEKSVITFDDVGKAAEKAANNQKKWADNAERLSVRTEELRSKQLELEKAIAIKKATEEGATPETIKSMEASYDKAIANEKEAESEKALAKSKRDRAAAERDSKKASKDFIKNFGDEDFSTNADTEATGFSRTITSTYDEETALERLDRERNLIQMYQELEIGDAQAHADAIKAIDQEIADEKKKALDDQVKEQRNATNAQLNIYSQLFSGMQSLTSNMLASMDEQSSGYKAMFAVNKAFAVAQAIVSAELAAAQVLAHDAGIMGMSAAATSNAIRAMGYASAGVIAGTAIAGGRLYGGAVQANGMYRINENGAPEVFNAANGQQYMLPNTRGEVVSNKDASGSGSTVIQVNISSDGSVSTDGGSMMAQFGKEIGQFVEAKFKQMQSQSMRQGGAIWQYMQKGK
jgi:hypothetical protein